MYRIAKNKFGWIPAGLQSMLGWCVTVSLVMLGWIPFRAADLADTLALYSKLFQFSRYRTLGFRENFYLIVFVFTAGMIGLYFLKKSRIAVLQNPWVRQTGEVIAVSTMLFIIFVFLKPVSQFIYFQF
jgi:hypothetical protein